MALYFDDQNSNKIYSIYICLYVSESITFMSKIAESMSLTLLENTSTASLQGNQQYTKVL